MAHFVVKEHILKDGSPLCRVGTTSFAQTLTPHLPFVRELTGDNVRYHSFLFFLLYGDGNRRTGIVPWSFWQLLRTTLKESRPGDVLELHYYRNVDPLIPFLREEFGVRIKKSGRSWFGVNAWRLGGRYTPLFFKLRTLLKKKKTLGRLDILCSTSYDRYYANKGFFPDALFQEKKLQRLVPAWRRRATFYHKYDTRNLSAYLKASRPGALFLEDFLSLSWRSQFTRRPRIRAKATSIEERYITAMYRLFLKDIWPFINAYYQSIVRLLEESAPRAILCDSEKSLAYTLFALARRTHFPETKLIAFSHELITPEYETLPYKHLLPPENKHVWNNAIKEFLHRERGWPRTKLIVFPDPRTLKWKRYKQKKNSILIVSQGHFDFYEQLLKAKESFERLHKKGFEIFFKPHPAEWIMSEEKRAFLRLVQRGIVKKIITLSFIPEYTIGASSILLYEMAMAGSNVFYQDKEGWFGLVAPKQHARVSTIKDALEKIARGERGWRS